MRKTAFQMVLAVAALALVLPVLAKSPKPKPDAKPKTVTMNFYGQTNLAGTMVNAGTYKLVIESDKLTVENGNKTIASVPGHWEDRKQKANSTGFTTDNGQVKEILVDGDSSVFVLGQS